MHPPRMRKLPTLIGVAVVGLLVLANAMHGFAPLTDLLGVAGAIVIGLCLALLLIRRFW